MMRFEGAIILLFGVFTYHALADTHYYDFIIQETPYTHLCHTKNILTVNGQFPGPMIDARNGDIVVVNVINQAKYNITIHWHGVNQPRNPWSDGPEYITQCPIQPGSNFTYRVDLSEKEGTAWWHAHSDWDRATVHGAIVVRPRLGDSFPFAQPAGEIPFILGEWWKTNVREVIAEALQTGGSPNISDAYTINGQPGQRYPCSENDTFTAEVETGKTYLLRVVNAAVNNEFFFAIEGHRLTVVGTDAAYTKPFDTDYIMITPGQTFDLLLNANSTAGRRHYIAARTYASADGLPFDTSTTTAVLRYSNTTSSSPQPSLPCSLPASNDTNAANAFVAELRSLASTEHPADVPQTIDRRIVITVAVNLLSCEPGNTCDGPQGNRVAASLNNISFVSPVIDVLEAYYRNISGVFGTGFPDEPPLAYNYNGDNPPAFLLFPRRAAEVKVLEYNTSVEVVFQGTSLLGSENHPMHIHGFSFYVVGRGFGNFDNATDPSKYNLVDPPFENTVGVPKKGWAAIRFAARNPGVWFMHCHFDRHASWGMSTIFIVKDGNSSDAKILPPPAYMPPC